MIRFSLLLSLACYAQAADWSAPAEVEHDSHRVAAYRAKVAGGVLAIEVKLEPGWHTFAIDNKIRADEKLAGKKSLGLDQPTEITLDRGLKLSGKWLQSPPKDFSKPDLRWYAWGFEGQAMFAAKVQRSAGPAKVTIRGQACTDTVCKNVDVELDVPAAAGGLDTRSLVPVR